MSFGIYVFGYLIVIGGLTYGATLMKCTCPLDRGWRSRAGRSRDRDGRQGYTSEGLGELNMKAIFWIGLVLLILGVTSLLVPIPRNERNGVNVGGVSVGIETRHDEKASPIVSAVMILGGAGLMIAGKGRS